MKRALALVISLLVLGIAKSSATEYEYGFILSCGQTVYRAFSHQLTDDELLKWADYYEYHVCHVGSDPFQPSIGD